MTTDIKIEVDKANKVLKIEIPLISPPALSSTGKMKMIGQLNWNQKIEGTYEGKSLKGSINIGFKA